MTSPTPPSEPPSDSLPEQPGNEPDGQPTRSELDAVVSRRVRSGIAVAITAVWALSFIADVVSKDYEAPIGMYVLMIGLAAAIYGSNFGKGMRP